jgi:hypothetical protein
MNKAELISAISKKAGTTKADAEQLGLKTMATKDRGTEVDFEAAPCFGQDAELKEAMQTLRQPKGGPSDSLPSIPKRRGCTKATANAGAKAELKVDLKSELTLREMKFLEIYLTGEHSINDAMKLAGYNDMTDRNRYLLAKKIVFKHESQAGDLRKILRMAGLGEITVALKIIELMKCDSKTVQIRACELAAKCLGMTKETAEIHPGITIVIQGTDQGPTGPAPGRPAQPEPKALPSPTPLCITR